MATDCFLKLDGIDGESTDKVHAKEIDVESFSWGAQNAGAGAFGGGHGTGKVSFQDFHFTQKVNKASPTLMLYCATGKHIKKAQLTVRKAGEKQQEYLVVKFEDLIVSGFQASGAGQGDLPMESISLNFTKVEFNYKPQKADGSLDNAVTTSYDIKQNVKG